MPTVSSTLKMFDAMSGPLKNITNSLNLVISTMQRMQSTVDQNVKIDRTLVAAKQQLAAAEAGIRHAIDQATAAQKRFNQSVQTAKSETNQLLAFTKKVAAAYLSAQAAQSAVQAADTFVSTQARLNLIVDEGQSVEQLQDQIFAAAQRARGDFVAMANSVAKLGMLAGDAFKNNDEIVAFAETMQKAFKVSGASIEEQTAGMYQLTQAMAAGKLQGDEFRSIMENAPMLADAIAKFTGKSKGELKEMSAKGEITADIIKAALFMAADDINKKFETMPKTFGDLLQQLKNEAFRAFQPVFQRWNQWLNSAQGAAVIQKLTQALYVAAQAADVLLGTLIWIANTIQSNWSIIEPILVTIGSALLPILIRQTWMWVQALWATVRPILAQAAAWLAANWPILLIGAAIGFLIYALYQWGDATSEVIGYVTGIFGALFAGLYNQFAFFANIVLSIAEFFINVWKDPVYAVKKLFYDLVINVLEWLGNLAKGIEDMINKIPGVEIEITSGIEKLTDHLKKARDNLQTDADIVNLPRLKQQDYAQAFEVGKRMGKTAGQWMANGVQKVFGAAQDMLKMPEKVGALASMPNIDKVAKIGEVGKIRDTVDISSEDLKMMRELAEMKSIQNFVSLRPSVRVQTGPISKDVDVDTVIARIEEALTEQIASSVKGVFRLV